MISLANRVREYASTHDSFTVGDIALALDANPDSVRAIMATMLSRGEVERIGKRGRSSLYQEIACQKEDSHRNQLNRITARLARFFRLVR